MSNIQITQQSGFINPQTYEQAWQFSEMLANSEMVPKNFKNKPADILIAMQMGSEIGLKPMQSLQNIAVVNGRPTIWGDAVVAICQSSGMLEDITEEVTDDYATVTVKRAGQEPHSVTFSMADAKQAGLSGKAGPWTQYPKRMMKNRARAFALRDKFADVLSGFGITEEEKDRVVDVVPETRRSQSASEAGIAALLETLPEEPESCYNPAKLLEAVGQITNREQLKNVGQEVKKLIDDDAINIKQEDIDKLRDALFAKKSQLISDELTQQINQCQTLDDADKARAAIDAQGKSLTEQNYMALNEALAAITEEIGAAG